MTLSDSKGRLFSPEAYWMRQEGMHRPHNRSRQVKLGGIQHRLAVLFQLEGGMVPCQRTLETVCVCVEGVKLHRWNCDGLGEEKGACISYPWERFRNTILHLPFLLGNLFIPQPPAAMVLSGLQWPSCISWSGEKYWLLKYLQTRWGW